MNFNGALGVLAVSTVAKKLKKSEQAPFLILGASAGTSPKDVLVPVALAQQRVSDNAAKTLREEISVERSESARLRGELESHVAATRTFLRDLQKSADVIDIQNRVQKMLDSLPAEPAAPTAEATTADFQAAVVRIADAIERGTRIRIDPAGAQAAPNQDGQAAARARSKAASSKGK